MAVQITDSNFKTEVLDSNKVVLIDFWAEWCGPCKAIGPMIEEISKEYEGKAVVGKVDVDNNPETAMKYGIRNIPTLLFIKNGQVVDKQVGAVPKANLVALLNKHLS
ncbi:MAG: thioredoxin [Chitinophagales bacterium]